MSTETAARYLSVSEDDLFELATMHSINLAEIGDGVERWRRVDLDRLIRKLPVVDVPQSKARAPRLMRLDANQIETIAEIVAQKLSNASARPAPRLVSINEACALLGLGRSSVYRLIGDGQLEYAKIGRRTLVRVESIQALTEGD